MDEIQRNKELCEKYFFLVPTNRWTGEVVKDYDYSYTELDAMPDGWRKAFGEELCAKIMKELNKKKNRKYKDSYCITQIKEKYGGLRWYTNWSIKKIDKIIRKYERLSEKTCINCGAPATKISTGWISPFCDKCAKEIDDGSNSWQSFIPIKEYFKEHMKMKKLLFKLIYSIKSRFGRNKPFIINFKER